MYAIVEIAGQQFKVEDGKKIFVHRLDIQEGETVKFDQVLLLDEDGKITIGEPTIKDAVVEGKILDNTVRGDKVIVFKKKRKKGYRVRNGHRQNFTQVEIVSINGKSTPKETVKKEAPVASEAPATEAKAATKKTAEKKPVAKKVTEKKPAEKKAATKKTKE